MIFEVVQRQGAVALRQLKVRVPGHIVLSGQVVTFQHPFIFDVIHDDHALVLSKCQPVGRLFSFKRSMSMVALSASSLDSGFSEYGVGRGSAGRCGP